MAFSVGNFVKNTGKSVIDRLVDGVISGSTTGLASSTKSIAKSTAESLINTGASYTNTEALSALKALESASGGGDEYFTLAGQVASRVGSGTIAQLRRAGSNADIERYLADVNPASKINRNRDSLEILSVL